MTLLTKVAGLAASLVLAGLLLAGCVPTSENPIVTKNGRNDPALAGAWRGKMEDGGPVYIHFLQTKDGGLSALLVTGGETSAADQGWAAFTIVTAEVNGTRYISALWDLNDGKPVEAREKGYHLMRYAILPDGALQLSAVNEEKLKAAVQAGKVEGQIEGEGGSGEVRLTASSEKLVKFLKQADPADLFDRPFAKLTKLAS